MYVCVCRYLNNIIWSPDVVLNLHGMEVRDGLYIQGCLKTFSVHVRRMSDICMHVYIHSTGNICMCICVLMLLGCLCTLAKQLGGISALYMAPGEKIFSLGTLKLTSELIHRFFDERYQICWRLRRFSRTICGDVRGFRRR